MAKGYSFILVIFEGKIGLIVVMEGKRTKVGKDLLVGGSRDLSFSTKGETLRGWLGEDSFPTCGFLSSLM